MEIDQEEFDQDLWEAAKITELNIPEIPIDVHYILNILDIVKYDTESINQQELLDYLLTVEWE
jgi:hypothetical protein